MANTIAAILERIRTAGYSQAQLVTLLDEHQPSVSNLLKGRVASVSIEKLLRYADRLGLETSLTITPSQPRPSNALTREPHDTKPARPRQAARPA